MILLFLPGNGGGCHSADYGVRKRPHGRRPIPDDAAPHQRQPRTAKRHHRPSPRNPPRYAFACGGPTPTQYRGTPSSHAPSNGSLPSGTTALHRHLPQSAKVFMCLLLRLRLGRSCGCKRVEFARSNLQDRLMQWEVLGDV